MTHGQGKRTSSVAVAADILNAIQQQPELVMISQEEHALKPPDQAYLKGLEPGSMTHGQGKSDFIDAVTVAADILNRAVQARPELEKQNVAKEIVLISNFRERVKEEDVHEFVAALVKSLKTHDVRTSFADLKLPVKNTRHPPKQLVLKSYIRIQLRPKLEEQNVAKEILLISNISGRESRSKMSV